MGSIAAKQMLESNSLAGLLELEIHGCPIGDAAAVLVDTNVMPKLVGGGLWYCGVPGEIKFRLAQRPELYCYWASYSH